MSYILTVTLNPAVDTTYVLDHLEPGAIHRVQRLDRAAGGKGNNVARVLRLLGAPVVATGFAGGHAGAMIAERLQAQGITAAFEPIAGESRTCLTIVDGERVTEIREPGPTLAPQAFAAFVQRFASLLSAADAVAICGSLPPGVPDAAYATLINAARRAGVFVALDSSGAALTQALAAGPDLVKPNRQELATWAGTDLADEAALGAALRRLCAAGPGAAAVSLGAAGLWYACGEGAWRAEPPPIRALNTVGSGDSLLAGLVYARWRRLPQPEALALAVACGTANALTDAVAAPDPQDIARLQPLVTVRQL